MNTGWNFINENKSLNLSLKEKRKVKDLQKAFLRCFSTLSGKQVLEFLKSQTTNHFLGANSTDNELRYLEGQRKLVFTILNMIKKAKEE